MSKFTKDLRQEIVTEFAKRHNGIYNPVVFLREVREKGVNHPAHDWFKWDDEDAAGEYRLWQARCFAKDLRISFEVEEVGRSGAVKIKTQTMPMVLSPTEGRKDGGGYVLTDPSNGDHQAEHCRQAASALRAWFRRYGSALTHAGIAEKSVDQMIAALDKASPAIAEAAE